MIEVADVRQTPREMRPASVAWRPVRAYGYFIRAWLIMLCLITLIASWWIAGPTATLWVEGFAIVLLAGYVAPTIIFNRMMVRVARRTPLGDPVSHWLLDEKGVRITYDLGDQSLDWRAIVQVIEEKDRIVFAVTPARNHVLPVRCFGPGQFEAFRALVADVRASGRLGAG